MNQPAHRTRPILRIVVALIALGVLVAGVAMLSRERSPTPHDRPEAQRPDAGRLDVPDLDVRLDRLTSRLADGMAPSGSALPATSAALPPTPPPDATFAESKEALLQRADAGDAEAACRFGAELLLCSDDSGFTSMAMEGLSEFIADADPERQDMLVSGAGLRLATNDAAIAHCAGIDRAELPDLHARLERLMRNGSVRARVLYALQTPGGGLARVVGRSGLTLQPGARQPVSQFYADNAGAFLREGIAARDPLAIEGMILLHAPQRAMGAQALPMWLPNPVRFVAYLGLWESLGLPPLGAEFQRMRDNVWPNLDLATQARVREVVEAERRRWQADPRAFAAAPPMDVDTLSDLCQGP